MLACQDGGGLHAISAANFLFAPLSMPQHDQADCVQADYWRQMLGSDNPLVEYGNDVEGTAFCSADADDPLGSSSWNLQARNQLCPVAHDPTLLGPDCLASCMHRADYINAGMTLFVSCPTIELQLMS